MSATLMRLFYLGCELKPDLPDTRLMRLLGNMWSSIISAGSQHGLAGSTAVLPNVQMEQLSAFYMAGADTGASPDIDEFRSGLAGAIYREICGNENLSLIEQMTLSSKLHAWYQGKSSMTSEEEIDWDQEITVPPFTKTGWFPIDKIHGDKGLAQEVCTVLSQPEIGKTTTAIALAAQWRRDNRGPVIMLQTEIAPSALRMKIDGMCPDKAQIFRPGIDRLVFGRRNVLQVMDRLIEQPDQDRLVLFDSLTGYCGPGSTPDSQNRYWDTYETLCQLKSASRMVIAFTHVKRGVEIANIESAAGSSAIERFSGSLIYLSSDKIRRPNGMVDLRIEVLKNRYAPHVPAFEYTFDYETGKAYPIKTALEQRLEEQMEKLD